MDKNFSVGMSLVDFIPIVIFVLANQLLYKNIKDKMNGFSKALYLIGFALTTVAPILKATYKLLCSLNVGDFIWMSNQFFSNQAFGSLLIGVGITLFVLKPNKSTAYSLLPTMALVGILVFGTGAMDASLSYIANKMKKRNALVCFIVSFFMYIAMGYLSSKDFTTSYMNWIAEIVNIVGQLLLYSGIRILDKAGLKNY